MKKLNLKLVVILSVSFAIFTLITFFVHRFQVTRSSATLIVRADQAREAKDFEEAAHLRLCPVRCGEHGDQKLPLHLGDQRGLLQSQHRPLRPQS